MFETKIIEFKKSYQVDFKKSQSKININICFFKVYYFYFKHFFDKSIFF